MIALFLILIPMLSGIVSFFLKKGSEAKTFALLSVFATVIVSLLGLTVAIVGYLLWIRSRRVQQAETGTREHIA